MYNTSNPAELYPNTTWELLPDNKFLKTGSTPLQQSGSNSISITKANLPNVRLSVSSFSLTTQPHKHRSGVAFNKDGPYGTEPLPYGKYWKSDGKDQDTDRQFWTSTESIGNTGTASPSTETLGSGTAIAINPEHIVIKAWKRLS